jgi:hypothetical protein
MAPQTSSSAGAAEVYCRNCGHVGSPLSLRRGSRILECLLYVLVVVPGVAYTLWRKRSQYLACAQCRGTQLMAADSPLAQAILAVSSRNVQQTRH